jgi:hypothetical protein
MFMAASVPLSLRQLRCTQGNRLEVPFQFPYTDCMKNMNTTETKIKHYIIVDRYKGTVSILDLNDEDAVENLNWFMENGEKSEGEGGYITWDGEEAMLIQVPA